MEKPPKYFIFKDLDLPKNGKNLFTVLQFCIYCKKNFTYYNYSPYFMTRENLTEQKVFLERVKKSQPSNISFIDELAEVLGIGTTSVYRRIRGETPLTYDEILKICSHYKLNFDISLSNNTSSVSFNYNSLPPSITGFKYYLRGILEELKLFQHEQNKKIIYIAEDIPIFHLFAFPELASFKMYYWMKSVLNVPEYQNSKYSYKNMDKEIQIIGDELLKVYGNIESVEIWTEYTANSLRKQIEYYWDAGLFEDKNDAEKLCNQSVSLVRMISRLAEKSSKENSKGQNYNLYYSEIEIGNNCIYISGDGFKKVYLTYNTFNKMNTTDEKFCDETYTWIKYLIGKSNLISGASEKQRLLFENKTISQIELTLKKVSKITV